MSLVLSSINTGEPAYLQGKLWQYTASILIYFSFQGANMQWIGPIFSKICGVCLYVNCPTNCGLIQVYNDWELIEVKISTTRVHVFCWSNSFFKKLIVTYVYMKSSVHVKSKDDQM